MPRRERNLHDPLEGAAASLQPVADTGTGAVMIMPAEGVIYRRVVPAELDCPSDVMVDGNVRIRPLGTSVRVLYVGSEAVLEGARDGSYDRPFAQLGDAVQLLERSGSPVCAVYHVPDGALMHFRDPDPPFDVARYLETKNRAYAASQTVAEPAVMPDELQKLSQTNNIADGTQDE